MDAIRRMVLAVAATASMGCGDKVGLLDEGGEDTTTTGPPPDDDPFCDEGDGAFAFAFESPALPPRFDATCTVETLAAPYESIDATLSCTGNDELSAVLSVATNPGLGTFTLAAGQSVRVQYHSEMPWWIERWLLVTDAASGALLVAGIDGPTLASPDGLAPLAAYDAEIEEDPCPVVSGECGDFARPRLEIFGLPVFLGGSRPTPDESAVVFLDRSEVFVGAIECSDTPASWWTAGAVGYPLGR